MLIFSCRTDSKIGYSIFPDDELLDFNITDTISLKVYTQTMDTIVTNGVNELLAGNYTDDIFGYMKASFACQFSNHVQFINFEAGDIVDSVVLSLPYVGTENSNYQSYYGDTTDRQTIRIFRLNQDLNIETKYYGNTDPEPYTTGDLLGETFYYPVISDSILNIRLDNSLAYDFFDEDDETYTDQDNFKNFFKGIYVDSNSDVIGEGAIVKYKMNSNLIIKFYFRTAEDTLEYKISASNISNVRFNLFEHNHNGTPVADVMDQEVLQDSVAYIQAGGGLRTKIYIPYLLNLNNLGDILIYRAELLVKTAPADLTNEGKYPAINKLLLFGLYPDNQNLLLPLPDYLSGEGYGGEIYENNYYSFDIASYIQNLLDGKTENLGLFLFTSAGINNFHRSVITSGNNSEPMRLVITYGVL